MLRSAASQVQRGLRASRPPEPEEQQAGVEQRQVVLRESAVPLVFLRQAAEPSFELEPQEQRALQPELAGRPAAQPASEAQEEQPPALRQPEEPRVSAVELPPLPSSA